MLCGRSTETSVASMEICCVEKKYSGAREVIFLFSNVGKKTEENFKHVVGGYKKNTKIDCARTVLYVLLLRRRYVGTPTDTLTTVCATAVDASRVALN